MSIAPVLPQNRWMSLIRAGYGTALICAPRRLMQARTGSVPSPGACAVCRVLGARHIAQAVICAAFPARWLIRAGASVDLLHAASMLALAGEAARLRPALLTDSAIECAFGAAGRALLRGARPLVHPSAAIRLVA